MQLTINRIIANECDSCEQPAFVAELSDESKLCLHCLAESDDRPASATANDYLCYHCTSHTGEEC
jgi:hypothetical protein